MENSKVITVANMVIERDKLLLALSGLSSYDAEGVAFGEWSAKDIVCHLAAWEREAAKRLTLISEGRADEIVYIGEDEVDAWNARVVSQSRGVSWADALVELTSAREALLEVVASLSEAQFNSAVPRIPISVWLPGWTAEHDAEHSAQILAWRSGQGI